MRSVHTPTVSLALLILGIATSLSAQQPPLPAVPVSAGPRATHGPPPNTYGGSAESKFLVPATAFFPGGSGSSTTYSGISTRYAENCCGLYAPLHLPSGAKIVSLELDYYDVTAAGYEVGTLTICDFHGRNCTFYPSAGDGPSDCIVAGFLCSGVANAPGDGLWFSTVIANDNITIDNVNNQYYLTVGGTFDGSTAVASMIVGYKLQVSAAPAVATFTDVPTNDFAFQFIEAFNAAGITVGCNVSPPQYCPDSNVTRREMAVFFAKALGLQFP
jgi:hypothetical protein